jgi:hypothetical protein
MALHPSGSAVRGRRRNSAGGQVIQQPAGFGASGAVSLQIAVVGGGCEGCSGAQAQEQGFVRVRVKHGGFLRLLRIKASNLCDLSITSFPEVSFQTEAKPATGLRNTCPGNPGKWRISGIRVVPRLFERLPPSCRTVCRSYGLWQTGTLPGTEVLTASVIVLGVVSSWQETGSGLQAVEIEIRGFRSSDLRSRIRRRFGAPQHLRVFTIGKGLTFSILEQSLSRGC